MKSSNSKIPTFNLDVAVEKASPSLRNRSGKSIETHLNRDVQGIVVPEGRLISLKKDTVVQITQSLGSSFTIAVEGRLVRISGEDGDALNQEKKGLLPADLLEKPITEDTIKDMLKTVYDPEIPVNIVDLGLVYRIDLPTPSRVNIDLTLTAPGCGMGEVLVQEIELKLKKHPRIDHANINLVFSPPWDRSRLSTAAQLELGLL